ncbi:phosphatase domain-containing putative toxin [Acidimangrovimonas pyrenivorans]|uniref:Protein-tyrosine phosphatase family protein n=1 Tax=Acidimangrovimonas pyrenivorans TaxID=2030798 RepID=A0ABV7AHT8_9RHOB
MNGFEIAELPVLAGRLALCAMPGSGGDYAADLTALLDWRPDAVATLAETEELAAAGAESLGTELGAAGILRHSFPIADFGVPGAVARALWPELSATLRARLAAGDRVLVHCRGGCGRSGMVVLRLMIETGEAPAAALARLRAARACAVETEAQMRWALGD